MGFLFVAWLFVGSLVAGVSAAFVPTDELMNGETIVADDFNGYNVGAFPEGWMAWRGDTNRARRLYTIQEEHGNRYLHARDDGHSIIIRKELRSWNPRQYPILTWRWRARVLPRSGDERVARTNDSATAVYVVLSENLFHIPKTLKYVWSTTTPVGTIYRRSGIGRPYVIVLESGPTRLGTWVSETVNVYEDYQRAFGEKPPNRAVGLGVLTDGNATRSVSEGDYDDFVIRQRTEGL
ncbi:MAG: DUF3047 domain-containing protein [Candidatus Latescibacteria bacterium]|nr:DUF3047 domain-containing protein [Candidatus Latescibacterota bacterium]